MSDWYGVVTAGCSAVAALLAALATWLAPIKAARLAEGIRRSADTDRRLAERKVEIFSILMQERARIGSENSVRALNLIDVVFLECGAVRDAWAKLYKALDHWGTLTAHERGRVMADLLTSMAKEIGLAANLRADDLDRIYFPAVLAEEQFIRDMTRQETLSRMASKDRPASEATQTQTSWPPPPG